jgi:hypothetical protein
LAATSQPIEQRYSQEPWKPQGSAVGVRPSMQVHCVCQSALASLQAGCGGGELGLHQYVPPVQPPLTWLQSVPVQVVAA